jgi:glyoxylase-like metal-dependent hydrolase (beta-lactamase superfamily II)
MAEEWTEVGDRVFVRRHRSLDLNIGAVLTEDGVILIDSRATHVQAEELASSLSAITGDAVRWLINTHHHWDHTFGNYVFRSAAIWGHQRCAQVLEERGEAMKERLQKAAPDHAKEFAEVVVTPPQYTFTDSMTVAFGGVDVEMRFLGRGHTDNDIAVSLPTRGVVFAGDLIEEGAPPSFDDSFPLEWPATLEELADMSGDVVVPGHGGIGSASFIRMQRDELSSLVDLARNRHAEGMTAEEASGLGGPYPQPTLLSAFRRAWLQLAG